MSNYFKITSGHSIIFASGYLTNHHQNDQNKYFFTYTANNDIRRKSFFWRGEVIMLLPKIRILGEHELPQLRNTPRWVCVVWHLKCQVKNSKIFTCGEVRARRSTCPFLSFLLRKGSKKHIGARKALEHGLLRPLSSSEVI